MKLCKDISEAILGSCSEAFRVHRDLQKLYHLLQASMRGRLRLQLMSTRRIIELFVVICAGICCSSGEENNPRTILLYAQLSPFEEASSVDKGRQPRFGCDIRYY